MHLFRRSRQVQGEHLSNQEKKTERELQFVLEKVKGEGEMLQVAVPVPADRQTDRHRFEQTEIKIIKES